MKRIVFCCAIVALLFSCGKKNTAPTGRVLEFNKMKEVMWDIFQAEAYTDRFLKKDSSKNALAENAVLQQRIFELHGIKKEDYDTSYSFYSYYPELMNLVLDSISANAEKKRSIIMKEQYSKPTLAH